MNIVQQIEAEQVAKISGGKKIDAFKAGDIVRVGVKIIEGSNERVQTFEGLVIAKKDAGVNSAFTVRKISHGEGVERIFPLHSPRIDSIERVRAGEVRRAKLYYLRGRTGKSARIREKVDVAAIAAAQAGKKAEKAEAKADKKA
jgi:large subunit ribosomal protein L19